MDHFEYRQGRLWCDGVDLTALADRVGTPTYVYSAATLRTHYDRLAAAFAELNPTICFAVKSCPNIHILRLLVQCGAGMDVVSGGELMRADLAGVPRERVVYAGVGKTDDEIRMALRAQRAMPADPARSAGPPTGPIGHFNVESEPEFAVIDSLARDMGVRAMALVRVNPEVAAGGHAYIATAKKDSKFGVSFDAAKRLFARHGAERAGPGLFASGLHIHIGSSINDPGPHERAITRTLAMADEINAAARANAGTPRDADAVRTLDIGGGFGADYTTGDAPPATAFAQRIVPLLRERVARGLRIILEPGRTIAASAGLLLTRVQFVKPSLSAESAAAGIAPNPGVGASAEGAARATERFIVCDAGMHTLLRPSLYSAFHFIWPASVPASLVPPRRCEHPDLPGLAPADVVGPICESGDFLAKSRMLPAVARGDLLAVFTAGAYGMSMASRYNSHPLPAEVLVDGDRALVIRERETLADLVQHESTPRAS